MTKIWLVIQLLLELIPLIKGAVNAGKGAVLLRRIRNGKKEMREHIDVISDPELEDDEVLDDIRDFNDLFRK